MQLIIYLQNRFKEKRNSVKAIPIMLLPGLLVLLIDHMNAPWKQLQTFKGYLRLRHALQAHAPITGRNQTEGRE